MATAASRDERNFCQTSIRHKKRGGGHISETTKRMKNADFSFLLNFSTLMLFSESNIYRECAASDVSPSSVKNMAGILLNTGTMI